MPDVLLAGALLVVVTALFILPSTRRAGRPPGTWLPRGNLGSGLVLVALLMLIVLLLPAWTRLVMGW